MERIENRENEKKKYVYLVFGLFLLMAMVTGATFAYFALTASNNNTITGNVGGTTLSLTVTKRFPTTNTNMIPQLESTLGEAISDTYSCVDDNGNVVCQVYQATIRNTGTTSAELEGVISFQNIDTLPNLKWARIEAERTMGTYTSYPATTSEALFEMGKVLAPNASASYYFVIWIDEIGVVQTDQGTFRATINFRSGGEAGGITSTIRPAPPLLSSATSGSYVTFTGNNGCVGTSCEGRNANYVDESNKGYCFNSNYKFKANGWRVAYVKEDTAYLVSAGATDCFCTNRDGTMSSTGNCTQFDNSAGATLHIASMNQVAASYCNAAYAYGGVCDSNSVWAMNATDFENILGKPLNENSCYNAVGDSSCGSGNDLIANGGTYWFATPVTSTDYELFYWAPTGQVTNYHAYNAKGVRPVLRLNAAVKITGGDGTEANPYVLSN